MLKNILCQEDVNTRTLVLKSQFKTIIAAMVLDSKLRKQVVIACAEFPRTESIATKATVVEDSYDGSLPSFMQAVQRVTKSAELRVRGVIHASTKEILDLISDQDMFDALILDAVDALVVQRAGSHIVRITRTLSYGEERVPGSRTVLIDTTEAASRAAALAMTLKPQDNTDMITVVVAACFVVTVFGAIILTK